MQQPPAAPSLVNRAHLPLRDNTASSRQQARQACRRKPNPPRSTADDIRAATRAWQEHSKQQSMRQTGSGTPAAADEAAQRRLQEIAQAVQSVMASKSTSDNSKNMTYEDILNTDHDTAGANVGDMHDILQESANDMQKPANSQGNDRAKMPEPSGLSMIERLNLMRGDPVGIWTRASLLGKAYYCILTLGATLALVVAVVVLFVAVLQIGKFLLSCASSMTRIHTWLIISGLTVIALITPQAPKVNGLLRFVDDYNLFANYGQAKHAISMVTWSSIALFLVLVLFVGSIS